MRTEDATPTRALIDAAKNGKAPPPAAPKKPQKGPRPPLERTFAQAQAVAAELRKLRARFMAWGTSPPSSAVAARVGNAAQDLSEAITRVADVAEACSALTSLGFRPAEVSGGGLQPGDRVELKKAALDRWAKLADHKDDLLHLVVNRVIGSDVVVDVAPPDGQVKRLGVLARGSLQLRKAPAGGDK